MLAVPARLAGRHLDPQLFIDIEVAKHHSSVADLARKQRRQKRLHMLSGPGKAWRGGAADIQLRSAHLAKRIDLGAWLARDIQHQHFPLPR